MRGRVTVNGEPPGRVGNALVGWTHSILFLHLSASAMALRVHWPVDRETGEFTMFNCLPVFIGYFMEQLYSRMNMFSARVDGKDVLGGEITIGNVAPAFSKWMSIRRAPLFKVLWSTH
jgi:hypothetical protein